MDDKTKSTMLKGVELVKQARQQLVDSQLQIDKLTEELDAAKQASQAAVALGERIFQGMVACGRMPNTKQAQDRVIAAVGDPVKVAEELVRVLEDRKPVSVGSPDQTKSASEQTDPMAACDERYRRSVGLS
ncbi:MAG: hypothetical protein WC992_00245 [Acholeplasmataceae bacterium]